jgi:asparagine synthase (glutamine-hydrolysing)
LLLCQTARKDVTVALSGDGGDELFFGYEQHQALHWLFKLGVHRLPYSLRAAAVRPLGQLLGPLVSHRIQKLADILEFADEAELMQYFIGTIGPLRLDRIASLLVQPPKRGPALLAPLVDELRRGGLDSSARIEHVFQRTFLVDTVLAKTDRASMAYGLEARVPFLDNDLADFAAALPLKWKLHGGVSKYLLRRLLDRKLARRGAVWSEAERRQIVSRPKKGFGVPLREWWRGDLKYLLDDYLSPERLKREGLFAPEQVQRLVRGHLGDNKCAQRVWGCGTLQRLVQHRGGRGRRGRGR